VSGRGDVLPAITPGLGFTWKREQGGLTLRCEPLERVAGHLFTTRSFLTDPPDADVRWDDVALILGVEPGRVARLAQVHGREVVTLRRPVAEIPDWSEIARADIVVTDDPDLAVAVKVADCVPILIADRRSGAVAAAHAGWRGTVSGTASAAVAALVSAYDASPRDMVAAIGPAIGPCCYEVGEEVRDACVAAGWPCDAWFVSACNSPHPHLDSARQGRLHLDLWRANFHQLVASGLSPGNVCVAAVCTASDNDLFCSYRARGKAAGRMAGVIRARTAK
jgi:polyphenol oxidase